MWELSDEAIAEEAEWSAVNERATSFIFTFECTSTSAQILLFAITPQRPVWSISSHLISKDNVYAVGAHALQRSAIHSSEGTLHSPFVADLYGHRERRRRRSGQEGRTVPGSTT